ncbi:exonuclease 1-like [Montipora foliosa]|uniref:exonuclease 1-like n=1 Tax=Montipora foliosa TaxID=591990 RepID=UPI0035F0FEC4
MVAKRKTASFATDRRSGTISRDTLRGGKIQGALKRGSKQLIGYAASVIKTGNRPKKCFTEKDMGIQGLLTFLQGITTNTHLRYYAGKKIGVDCSCYLYKGAFGCAEKLGLGISTNEFLDYPEQLFDLLLSLGIKPVAVFDGQNLEAKKITREKRERSRKENATKAEELWRRGIESEAIDHFRRALKITCEMSHKLLKVLRDKNIDCIVAPFEADAQLAYLNKNQLIDVVLSEDSDQLVFGCSEVLYKVHLHGSCQSIQSKDIPKCLNISNYTFDLFRHMCIIAGCDYLESLPGIGIKRAHNLMKKVAAANGDVRKVWNFLNHLKIQ